MSKRRSKRPLIAVVLLAVAVWLFCAAAILWSGAVSASDGRRSMDDFTRTNNGNLAGIDSLISRDGSEEDPVADLRAAATSFGSASSSANSVVVAPLKVVPVLGRQIRSVAALSNAAAVTTSAAVDAYDDTSDLIDSAGRTNVDRVDAAGQVEATLVKLNKRLVGLDLGPNVGLVGPLRRARSEFADKYDDAMTSLDRAIVGVEGTKQFLSGPNKYLVLAANNAEMRAGSGMFLQLGTMDVENGLFELGDFEPSASMFLPESGSELDPTLEALWGPLKPTQEFRNVNLTPRFDESARMATEMWATSGREPVKGALALDVVGLKRLLKLSGPVQVLDADGSAMEITYKNVERKLLLEQYLGLSSSEQTDRKANLGEVAARIFESLNTAPVPLADLVDALRDMSAGRHLMLWSSDPTQQKAWEALSISGEMKEDDLLVALINRGGNKLDPFIATSGTIDAKTSDSERQIQVAVTMTNSTPIGLPGYVQGPYPGTDLSAGDYYGLLAVTVPGGAGNPSVEGAEMVGTAIDGPTKVIVAKVLIPRDSTLNVTVGFDLPTTWTEVNAAPSARTPATHWKAGSHEWTDTRGRRVQLEPLG